MLTLQVAQLVNHCAGDLKVGGSRQAGTHRVYVLFSLVSDGSLADICVVDFMLP